MYKIIAFIHALLPLAADLTMDIIYREDNPNWYEKYTRILFWLYFLGNAYVNLFVFYENTKFLVVGFYDQVRKYYTMKVLTDIVEPNKFKVVGFGKIMPMINIFDK